MDAAVHQLALVGDEHAIRCYGWYRLFKIAGGAAASNAIGKNPGAGAILSIWPGDG